MNMETGAKCVRVIVALSLITSVLCGQSQSNSAKHFFDVIERRAVDTAGNAPKECPPDFIKISTPKRTQCYHVIKQKMSWTSAFDVCSRKDAHLLIINDAEENNLIRAVFESMDSVTLNNCISYVGDPPWFWTAGQSALPNYHHPRGIYYWKTGLGTSDMHLMEYINWYPSFPNAETWRTCVIIAGDPQNSYYRNWATCPCDDASNPPPTHAQKPQCAVCEFDLK